MTSKPTVLVLADLDNTCFQARAKCTPGGGLHPVATSRSGEVICFQTSGQRRLVEWLMESARLIPVTGRNTDAMRRVSLEFVDYAIGSFGGVILEPGGALHGPWHERIATAAAKFQDSMLAAQATAVLLAGDLDVDARSTVVRDHGTALYLSIKHNVRTRCAELERLLAALKEEGAVPFGWRAHLNENNLAVMPPFLAKESAVAYLLDELVPGEKVTIGFADSASDAPYLALCDYAFVPTTSQLGAHLHRIDAYH